MLIAFGESTKTEPNAMFLVWGRQEIGTRKIKAYEQRTANFLRELTNVTIAIHDGEYVCPVESIQAFLANTRFSNSYISVAT